jgi:hypothetical protein
MSTVSWWKTGFKLWWIFPVGIIFGLATHKVIFPDVIGFCFGMWAGGTTLERARLLKKQKD